MQYPARLAPPPFLRTTLLLAGLCGLGVSEPPVASTAQKFINTVEHEWYKQKHEDIQEWYPFGHTNKAHGALLKQRGPIAPVSKDWSITNKAYLAEDDWYAVEWLYHATDVATGKKQVEATLGFAQIKDRKIVLWIEFFDDSVGTQQISGSLPLFAEKDEPFPWPVIDPPQRVYRP